MCVRTKTSFGCGHTLKDTRDCELSACYGLERFLFQKDGDCVQCRQGGDSVTRGREGKGRYAQEISRRSKTRAVLAEIDPYSEAIDAVEPWARPDKPEREWQSPTRRQADDAWLTEHEKRMADLQLRMEKLERRYSPSSDTQQLSRPRAVREDENSWDSEVPYEHTLKRPAARILPYEVRESDDEGLGCSERSRSRQNSHDSFEAMQLVRSGPRSSKKSYSKTGHDYGYDSTYGSYRGAKTEPFSSYTERHVNEVPGTYYSYGGSGYPCGFDVVERSPSYRYRR